MEVLQIGGLSSRQDTGSFEDALRRLNALERKLTEQVKIDIKELKKLWTLKKVDRVTKNAFRLYLVREQLKTSKYLFVEEEQILSAFNEVKEELKNSTMDEEDYEATKETCLFLGMKLQGVRSEQKNCYLENMNLEVSVNKEIMTLMFEDKDFSDLDLEHVRASTPVRKIPTPLQIHRAKSREPSPFQMQSIKIPSGRSSPFEKISQFEGFDQTGEYMKFRANFEAKQDDIEDDRSRPGSALSEMSLDLQNDRGDSRPSSRMSLLGDVVSSGKYLESKYDVEHHFQQIEDKEAYKLEMALTCTQDDTNANNEATKTANYLSFSQDEESQPEIEQTMVKKETEKFQKEVEDAMIKKQVLKKEEKENSHQKGEDIMVKNPIFNIKNNEKPQQDIKDAMDKMTFIPKKDEEEPQQVVEDTKEKEKFHQKVEDTMVKNPIFNKKNEEEPCQVVEDLKVKKIKYKKECRRASKNS